MVRFNVNKVSVVFVWLVVLVVLSGCGHTSNVCATEPPDQPVEVRQALEQTSLPLELEIRRQNVTVDQIVHGELCNAQWSGTVYVDCDVEVPDWDREEEPTFFDGCDLVIEPGTTVYVAFHNDEAYYKGCSCHYTEETHP